MKLNNLMNSRDVAHQIPSSNAIPVSFNTCLVDNRQWSFDFFSTDSIVETTKAAATAMATWSAKNQTEAYIKFGNLLLDPSVRAAVMAKLVPTKSAFSKLNYPFTTANGILQVVETVLTQYTRVTLPPGAAFVYTTLLLPHLAAQSQLLNVRDRLVIRDRSESRWSYQKLLSGVLLSYLQSAFDKFAMSTGKRRNVPDMAAQLSLELLTEPFVSLQADFVAISQVDRSLQAFLAATLVRTVMPTLAETVADGQAGLSVLEPWTHNYTVYKIATEKFQHVEAIEQAITGIATLAADNSFTRISQALGSDPFELLSLEKLNKAVGLYHLLNSAGQATGLVAYAGCPPLSARPPVCLLTGVSTSAPDDAFVSTLTELSSSVNQLTESVRQMLSTDMIQSVNAYLGTLSNNADSSDLVQDALIIQLGASHLWSSALLACAHPDVTVTIAPPFSVDGTRHLISDDPVINWETALGYTATYVGGDPVQSVLRLAGSTIATISADLILTLCTQDRHPTETLPLSGVKQLDRVYANLKGRVHGLATTGVDNETKLVPTINYRLNFTRRRTLQLDNHSLAFEQMLVPSVTDDFSSADLYVVVPQHPVIRAFSAQFFGVLDGLAETEIGVTERALVVGVVIGALQPILKSSYFRSVLSRNKAAVFTVAGERGDKSLVAAIRTAALSGMLDAMIASQLLADVLRSTSICGSTQLEETVGLLQTEIALAQLAGVLRQN